MEESNKCHFLSFFFPLSGIYPVDILEDDPTGHQEASLAYYTSLGEGAGTPGIFTLPTGEQVSVIFPSEELCQI
jgi:hypothetical protein